MAISMYQASVPVLIRNLKNLDRILEKAAVFAESRKFDSTAFPNYRLYPDMLPLSKQIQIASDSAKGCGARLAGVEVPKFEDNETTLPELQARIHKTISFLESLSPEAFEGSESRAISLPLRTGSMEMDGMSFLLSFVLPNFYFHVTTAYNILRHSGVELGKMDYLGGR
ncbi:MAG: DUF1993 family protein [Myxococcota bacterium]